MIDSDAVMLESEQAHRLEEGSRNYLVTVNDVEATNIQRVYPDAGQRTFVRQRVEPDDRLRRIVTRAAVRALYVLGVAAGDVEVATSATGRPSIVRIADRAEAGAGSEIPVRPQSGIMFGADPEFVLLTAAGKVAPASRYLPSGGLAGCDSVVRRGVRVWPLVELRPVPAADPSAVVRSLRRLMVSVNRRIGRSGDRLSWRAGAWPVPGLPLGGHVHISGIALTGELLRALDNAVALPLRLLEPPNAAARRPRYGALGDFRHKPHGGFEYRTPPSWLVSPRLAQGVLALARIACEHRRDFRDCRPLDDDALRDAFYRAEHDAHTDAALREAALSMFARLRTWSGYARDADAVEFVYRAVRDGRHWDESADFRSKWGIPIG